MHPSAVLVIAQLTDVGRRARAGGAAVLLSTEEACAGGWEGGGHVVRVDRVGPLHTHIHTRRRGCPFMRALQARICFCIGLGLDVGFPRSTSISCYWED